MDETTTDVVEVQAQLVAAQGQVSALTARVEGLQAQTEHLRRMADNRANDLRIIGARLAQEADDREWCEDYEVIVDRLFDEMSTDGDSIFREAARRDRDIEVRVEFSVVTTVRARNVDHARELIEDDLSEYVDFDYAEVQRVRESY